MSTEQRRLCAWNGRRTIIRLRRFPSTQLLLSVNSGHTVINAFSSAFASLYVGCGVLAAFAVLLRLTRRVSSGQRLLSGALIVPLVFTYLVGMHRSAGIDYDSYLAAYNDEGLPIPDLGYTALTWLTHGVGIGFSAFLLLQGVFTLAVLWVISKAKGADPVVVLVVYLLHLAIVRDMSQSRIGLAVAVYFLGQTQQRPIWKGVLYLFAASIHITVIVLMFVWTAANLTARLRPLYQLVVVYMPLVAFATFGTVLLNLASGLEPRIELYLSWDEAAYGAPLESFGSLGRGLVVVAVYCAAIWNVPKLKLRNYVVAEVAGAAIVVGLAQYSIFAARLSNVAVSVYPIGLGIAALAFRSRGATQRSVALRFALRLSIATVMATLLLRPGSYDVLREVVPTAFVF